MGEPRRRTAVISLASAPDDGSWITDFVDDVSPFAVTVDEHALESQLDASVTGRVTAAWIAIDHVLMGHLCRRIAEALGARGVAVMSLVHPRASVSKHAVLGEGVLVGAGSVIEAAADVGAHVRVHAGAIVGRGARIGAFCAIDPGCVIGDGARIGAHCWIRPGVSIESRASIGDHCEFHIPGVWGGAFPEGYVHLAGFDGPIRIHRFG
jgi:bifunctional N-acetylglucosamine-1-phosphate-uridyltransferase/glucosamine-1-phosphate-acetyltransferase GlmU-like protein